MVEHINVFQGLMNQTTSLEVPLADEILALLMLVVPLGNAGPEGKHLSLEQGKSSFVNEEARRKDSESISDSKALATEGDTNRGRGLDRSPGIGRSPD